MKTKNTCSICLENVTFPANKFLNCECKYYVHYKCYKRWWKENKKCIICHNTVLKAPTKHRFKKKSKKHNKVIISRKVTTIDHIENYLNALPRDNENEFKFIIISCTIIFFLSIFFKFYSNFYN